MAAFTENGEVEAIAAGGERYVFRPSFRAMAELGNPRQIVELFYRVHEKPEAWDVIDVLRACCDDELPLDLTGYSDTKSGGIEYVDGAIPFSECVILARWLLFNGVVGNVKRRNGKGGERSNEFDPAEFVSAAMIHFGVSKSDAENMTMTEFQRAIRTKYPEQTEKLESIPTKEEYDERMRKHDETMRRYKEKVGGK